MTWNVGHNFPGAKDTYEVPVDYPTVGYDTIIAVWFTDIFTSILAIQEAIIGATSIVLLKAGGTMTGDLEVSKVSAQVKLTDTITGFYIFLLADEDGAWIGANPGTPLVFASRVETENDIEIISPKGLVLQSPNFTRYRIIVANDGTLSTEAA